VSITNDPQFEGLRHRVLLAALGLLLVLAFSVVGYRILGGTQHGWMDALYMSIIMLSTSGLKEVIPTDSRPAMIFTMAVMLVGATASVYALSMITAFVVEGDLTQGFRRRRMQKRIDAMSGHFIVCGAGQTGSTVLRELVRTQRACVTIEQNHAHLVTLEAELPGLPALHGDCSDDETLLRAGIARAAGIVVCTDDDKNALVTTVLARQLNPHVRVIARASTDKAAARLRQAGADGVVSPAQIGGMRLVSELVRPTVVTFLDSMLRDTNRNLRIEEVRVEAGSACDGRTLASLKLRESGNDLLLVAIRTASGDYVFNPSGETLLTPGSHLIAMGDPASVGALRAHGSASAS
jgi:voltage-gated potassium channel